MPLYPLDLLPHYVSGGPFLGLDWGKKRIGLAISDARASVAVPLGVLHGRFWPGVFSSLEALRQENAWVAIIMGWPFLSLEERKESPAPKIQLFLQALLAHRDWPIALWSERYTTQEVVHWCPPGSKIKDVDAHAAALMLQDALHHVCSVNHP